MTPPSFSLPDNRSLLVRVLVTGLMVIGLMLPLGMVRSVVLDRQHLQDSVEDTIADSLAGPQQIVGPVVVMPFIHRYRVEDVSADSKVRRERVVDEQKYFHVQPESLVYKLDAGVEEKYKGIYKAQVFRARGNVESRFELPPQSAAIPAKVPPGSEYIFQPPYLALAISDVRGIAQPATISINGKAHRLVSGSGMPSAPQGVHAILDMEGVAGMTNGNAKADRSISASFALDVAGTRKLSIVPVGQSTTVSLKSPWPHPNFGGRFLPGTRSIDANGFTAAWSISGVAHKNGPLIAAGDAKSALEAFSVSFIEPVNIYQQAERAVKYGVLFIALTFMAFFLIESLSALRIHPVQYGLVGLALAIFFLLLVSLSEHLPFALAYAAAAGACVMLISYYLSHVLGGWRAALGVALNLGVLYAVMYGLLLSEDNALVLGTVLLFAVLTVVMVVTRRVDWYRAHVSEAAVSPEVEVTAKME